MPPNGASRQVCPVLHSDLLFFASLEAAGGVSKSIFLHAAQAEHVTNHSDVNRPQLLHRFSELLEKPVHVLRRIGVEYQFALGCFSSSKYLLLLCWRKGQDIYQAVDKFLCWRSFESYLQGRDIALLVTHQFRQLNLADMVAQTEFMQ